MSCHPKPCAHFMWGEEGLSLSLYIFDSVCARRVELPHDEFDIDEFEVRAGLMYYIFM